MDRAQHRVEQLLMPAIGRGEAEDAARERRELHVSIARRISVSTSSCTSSSRTRSARLTTISDARPETVRAFSGMVSQSATRAIDVDDAHTFADRVRGQEVLLYELAEGVAELVLAFLDHRRVRDRDAERVTEQRRHREPVGQASDERRLQPGTQVSGPARVIGEEHRREERGPHDQEEPRRPPLAGAQELRARGPRSEGAAERRWTVRAGRRRTTYRTVIPACAPCGRDAYLLGSSSPTSRAVNVSRTRCPRRKYRRPTCTGRWGSSETFVHPPRYGQSRSSTGIDRMPHGLRNRPQVRHVPPGAGRGSSSESRRVTRTRPSRAQARHQSCMPTKRAGGRPIMRLNVEWNVAARGLTGATTAGPFQGGCARTSLRSRSTARNAAA